ncbi:MULTISPECIES: hypothetical protein [Trichocoleus]|uniref:Uncharacterized protein n=1 Tax=Trichocoleus desertorum GB2-A4 TaxID=2933944 RepID=A0ABV0JEV6_9CYAN|nr:hypothetical protein [Trichocoleus sp. FACHB-46]MBD1865117.1 hypothetical protein [Trichocoleus sp. FACHB-46]
MSNKRMGGLGKLSDFGKTAKTQSQPEPVVAEEPKIEEVTAPPPDSTSHPAPQKQGDDKGKLVPINIKITRRQHEWLNDTARTVRENNSEPVPPNERVFPQHLIGAAIDLLQASSVEWSQVKNVEELRKILNL